MEQGEIIHNVRVDRLREAMRKAVADPPGAVMDVEFEGVWKVDAGGPQYSSILPTPGAGPVEVQADFPPAFGGWGQAPSAVQYCLYGSTACFASTFANVAATEGVRLRSLSVHCSARLNMQRFLGAGDAPVIESLRWTVRADADASPEILERLRVSAEERCPATWCLRNPVPVQSVVEKV